jgi:DNA polymerase III sliding clamp (beta) subunit (PCNA family)
VRLNKRQANALAWVKEAASADQTRPVLTHMELSWTLDDGALTLTATATNSYILASRTFPPFKAGTFECQPEEAGTVLVEAKPFADALKAGAKGRSPLPERNDTLVEITEGHVNVAAVDESRFEVIETLDASFPKWRTLIPDPKVTTDVDTLPALSGQYLTTLVKCSSQPVGAVSIPMRMFASSHDGAALKAWGFEVIDSQPDGIGTLTAVIMPIRL